MCISEYYRNAWYLLPKSLTYTIADNLCILCRYDEHSHERFVPGDPTKRAFTYFVLTGGRFVYASALRLAVLKLILSMTVRLRSL